MHSTLLAIQDNYSKYVFLNNDCAGYQGIKTIHIADFPLCKIF